MSIASRNWESFALLLIDVQKDFWTERMSQEFTDYEKHVRKLLHVCRHNSRLATFPHAISRTNPTGW